MHNDPVIIACPGCGLLLPFKGLDPPERYNATGECLDRYFELTCWTLMQGDSGFIHQHAVDAYAAQHSGGRMLPITTAFALIGLYLALERGYTGRQVQLAHMKIGKKKRDWPRLSPPGHPGGLTVIDVLWVETDSERAEMLMRWAASVWQTWEHHHQRVREITERVLFREGK